MRGLLIGLAAAGSLAGCDTPLTVPDAPGVCWRLVENGPNGKPEFRPIAPDVPSLEACAVRLDGIRMRNGRPMTGGFQGRYIYASDREVTAASGPKAQRYRIFTPEQLAKIREGLQTLIDAR